MTNNRFYTDQFLLDTLYNFYIKNSRIPTVNDFKTGKPNVSTIRTRFGTWENAIKLCGIDRDEITRIKLRNELLDYYNTYNEVPTTRKLHAIGGSCTQTFIKYFGSFKNALEDVELLRLREDKHQFCDTYTDQELLDLLKLYMADKSRIPNNPIMKKDLTILSTCERRFNGVYNAFKLIGYDIEKQHEQDLIDLRNDMINNYKELASILNEVPSSRDIEKYSREKLLPSLNSMSTYEAHFGSLYNLQIECGFIPTKIGRNKSDEDLLDDIVILHKLLGRTPSQNDLQYHKEMASLGKYSDAFGSWNKAVELAGLTANGNLYYSNNGEECLSYYELVFTNMLEKYKIKFTKENMYNEFMDTKRKYRFDYVVNINESRYFVEIFGMEYRDDYKDRVKAKIKLCKENDIPLVEIYPNDFTSNKDEDLYDMLMNKLNI